MADESPDKPTKPADFVAGTISTGAVKLSTDEIKAHGMIKTQVGALWLMGIICGLLALGAILVSLIRPCDSEKVWTAVSPIILAAVSGTVGFLAGEKSAQRNSD